MDKIWKSDLEGLMTYSVSTPPNEVLYMDFEKHGT